jgi:hypothetical protein
MAWWIWTLAGIYIVGFVMVFMFNMAIGPITPGLCLLRAAVWPWFILTGQPHGIPLRMD